ncbi:MAG: class I SAM-dependent methyltransferase [archaeon]|jgi:ubiquinone/menaquinone biosynthesis C-methylase UbiE|nr:class I SAM-dependent methyltransferase [archaeon]
MKNKIKTAYNELARYYLEMRKKGGVSHFYNEMVEMPNTLKLLGKVRGKKVLDLGCGPGRYASILSKKGAIVTGVDNSRVSIELAKEEAPQARFIIGDVENLPFKSCEFDIVLAALVVGHLKSWKKVFKEAKRVLKDNGIFVFSIYNPFRDVLEKKKWFLRKFRVAENYFDERPKYAYWSDKKRKFLVVHYHKTYETVINTILENGFEIIGYGDCKPIARAKSVYPRYYKDTIDAPNFCVWKLKKR